MISCAVVRRDYVGLGQLAEVYRAGVGGLVRLKAVMAWELMCFFTLVWTGVYVQGVRLLGHILIMYVCFSCWSLHG